MNASVGLVGCGGWGELILRDLKALGASVAVVARSDASRARAAKYGADAIVGAIDKLPLQLDGLVVAVSTDEHAPVIDALLPRQVPIFVEKAMTHDAVSARRVVEQAGDRVFVMDKWRYHPGVEAMRQLKEDGRLGRIVALHTSRLGWSMTHAELDPIWLLLPHDLAIMLHILGAVPKPVAARGCVLGPRAAELSGDLEIDGVHASVEVSSLRPVHSRSVTLVGEDGSVQLSGAYDDALVMKIGRLGARDAREERLALPAIMPLEAELRRFLGYLAGGPPPMSSAAEGLAVVEALVALRRLAGLSP